MKKQFDTPDTMKVKDRKYFKGNKKLKNIKMFEEFSVETVEEQVKATNDDAHKEEDTLEK